VVGCKGKAGVKGLVKKGEDAEGRVEKGEYRVTSSPLLKELSLAINFVIMKCSSRETLSLSLFLISITN
jgi:hypothetical protein